jgi:trimeric autotransporter adhesin
MGKYILYSLIVFLSINCQAQIITTIAGTGIKGHTPEGIPATAAELFSPSGVAVGNNGHIYMSDQNATCIWDINPAGIINILAGTWGVTGYSGDGGPATNAKIYWPTGLAVDRIGNVFIADQFNDAIRKVDTSGIITTIAGGNGAGYGGDNGPATAALFWHPNDVGVDTFGNVYVADRDNHVIRKINTAGLITTVSGNNIVGYGGDGGPATDAKMNFPSGLCVDKIGNIFVADLYNSRVRKIDTEGIITTIAGIGTKAFSGDGGPATAAEINDVSAICIDTSGTIYFTDYANYRIRKVTKAGIISSIAGNGSFGYTGDNILATTSSISYAEGVAVDNAGNVYIADYANSRLRKVTPDRSALNTCTSVFTGHCDVFPNPSTTGSFTIIATAMSGDYSLEILNTAGEVMYERQCGTITNEIDLSKSPPGIYTLSLKSKDISISRKLVVSAQNK